MISFVSEPLAAGKQSPPLKMTKWALGEIAAPLRKGVLDVQAVSLHLFLRNLAGDDLVGLIEGAVTAEAASGGHDWPARAGRALVGLLARVEGVSSKLANMVLAELFLAGRPDDPIWQTVGLGLVTIDSLIHKLLDRTGILDAVGAAHPYGLACYGEAGCEAVVRALATRIDASRFDAALPADCPLFVQKVLWRFCAAGELDTCNVAHVGLRRRCLQARTCSVALECVKALGGAAATT